MGMATDGYPYHPVAACIKIQLMSDQIPILIVGAGPTGLTLACELARRDIDFRIIDKNPTRIQTSNALGIQTRTLELLDDMGIVERFLANGHKTTAAHIHADGKDIARIPFDQLDSVYKFILMLPQSETERLLDERLNELGKKIVREIELVAIVENKDSVTATLKHADNKQEKITASYIIACDGSHSAVREKLHVAFPGEDIAQQFMVADVKVTTDLSADEITIFLGQKKLMAFFPIHTGRYRIAGNLTTENNKEITAQHVKTMIAQRSHGLFHLKEANWMSPFWIHSKIIKQMRHGRVFFAGDAAHIHSPLGGQGMNTGIQDAYNLAWKLALVIQSKANTSLLASYHAERHPVITGIVKTTERITNLMLRSNPLIAWLRKTVLKFVSHKQSLIRKITMQMTQLAIHYKNSPVIFYNSAMSSTSPQAGEKAPDVVISAKCRLADVLRGIQHTILFFTGTNPTENEIATITARVNWLHNKYAGVIKVHVIAKDHIEHCIIDESLAVHKRYNVHYAGVYLIRPDNYIAYCDNTLDKSKLARYLDKIFASH